MVKVLCKQKNPTNNNEWIEKEIYLDGYLKSNLDLGAGQLKKDWDQVWFIDGGEGDGKSNLAITCAYYVNNPETRHTLIDRIVINVEEADKVILNASPYDAIVIDEAFGGMSSGGSTSRINRLLQRRFTEIRAKNLFLFIVAPSFMDIQKYFAIWRSKALIHVYSKEDVRGFAAFFNAEKKKRLYILGRKQFYNYGCVPANFTFRFTKQVDVLIDYNEYKKRKANKNLNIQEENELELKYQRQMWLKIVERMDSCPKPLTQEQKAFLIELSRDQIRLIDSKLEAFAKKS